MSIPERSNRDREWFSLGKSAKDYPKDWIVIPVILAIEREAKGIRNVREESQAKRLPINWRSNKEVIELVRREIKNAKKEEQNIYDKVVTKIVNNALKIEVRVRAEIQSIWDSSNTNDLFSYKMSNWLKRKSDAQKK